MAVERDRRRAGALLRTAQRLHARNVRVELADAAQPRPEGAASTACSSIRRARVWERCRRARTCAGGCSPRAWESSSAPRAMILAAGAGAVRPGGVLVYSTCTISPTENERRIAAFLDANPGFSLDDLGAELPALRHPSPDAPETVLTLPHRDRTAGFFIARLRREG